MLRKLIFNFFILVSFPVGAQFVNHIYGSWHTDVYAYSNYHTDVFSIAANQACLTNFQHFSVGISSGRKFFLQEMAQYKAGVVIRKSNGYFAMQLGRFGNADYHQSSIGVAYARRMENVDLGIQFDFGDTRMKGYSGRTEIAVEGGMLFHVNTKMRMGVQVVYPVPVKWKRSGMVSAPVYSVGFGYDASENFFIGVMLIKIQDRPLDVQGGWHYSFNKELFARAGISCTNREFSLSIGFLVGQMRMEVSATLHPYLGLTPSIAILYQKLPSE